MDCCKLMEEVMEKFPFPFCRPITVNMDTLNMEAPGLGVHLYKETPSGNISKKGSMTVFLNYCPWCGEQLRETQ